MRAELAEGVDDGVVEASLLPGLVEAVLVGLEVGEVERIGGSQLEVDEFVAGFKQVVDAAAGSEPEVVAAFGADLEVGFEIGFADDLATGAALGPETFGTNGLSASLMIWRSSRLNQLMRALPSRVP